MFAVNMYIAAKSPMRDNLKYESIFPPFVCTPRPYPPLPYQFLFDPLGRTQNR